MKRKLRRAFSSLLVSYMATMVFTVSIGVITYYSALKVVVKDAVESNLTMLQQSSEVIDAHLKEVENVTAQIGFNPKVISFLGNAPNLSQSNDLYKAIDMWNYIQTYRFTSDFIYNFYVGFNNGSMIMSPEDMSLRLPFYYEQSLQYSGISYEQWHADFMEKYHSSEYMPAHNITIDGKTDSYITYIQSLPFGFKNNVQGTMFVLIAESSFHDLLYRGNLIEGGWSYISDANGTLLTSISEDNRKIDMSGIVLKGAEGFVTHKLAGEDMLLSYYTSPRNQWKYVSAIPNKVVMKKVDYIRKTTILILTIGLLIGMIIAVFFANRYSKPIRTLVKKFGEKFVIDNEEDSNEYHFLDHSISKLIHKNETLLSEIDKQIPLLTAALFDRLFRGEFNDELELEAAFADVGKTISGSSFVVIVLRLEWFDLNGGNSDRIEIVNAKRVIIKDLLYRELGDTGYIHDLRQERMAILLNFTQDDHEENIASTHRMIENLSDLLNKHTDIEAVFGLGSMCESLLDVYRSFKEALKALELVNPGRGEYIMKHDHIPKGGNSYYYPMEIEQRIMNLVKSGNGEEVQKLLEVIHGEVAKGSRASSNSTHLLIFDISATVYKLILEIVPLNSEDGVQSYNDFIEHVTSISTFQESYDYIAGTLMDLCASVNDHKKSHNFELKDKIIGFLDNNYQDGSLCLARVADHFGMSEVYLSQFFKEQTGENFSSYMEKTRMNQARELLLNGNLTVDEIAKQVGYLNANTFYKAFKRIEGVSPGTYRNK